MEAFYLAQAKANGDAAEAEIRRRVAEGVADLTRRLEALEKENGDLEERLESRDAEVTRLEAEVARMEAEVGGKDERISSLEREAENAEDVFRRRNEAISGRNDAAIAEAVREAKATAEEGRGRELEIATLAVKRDYDERLLTQKNKTKAAKERERRAENETKALRDRNQGLMDRNQGLQDQVRNLKDEVTKAEFQTVLARNGEARKAKKTRLLLGSYKNLAKENEDLRERIADMVGDTPLPSPGGTPGLTWDGHDG